MDIVDLIRARRLHAGMTQRALAERAGFPQSSIARIESKDIDPRWSTLERLLDALNMEVSIQEHKQRSDNSLIRQMLKLSPAVRVQRNTRAVRNLRRLNARSPDAKPSSRSDSDPK